MAQEMALNSGIKQEAQYSEILSLDTKLRSINVSAKSIGLETQYSKIKTTATNWHAIKDGDNIVIFDLINQEWIPIGDDSQKNTEKNGMSNLNNLIRNITKDH